MKCEECPDLDLQDDATRIFLNCHGTHPENGITGTDRVTSLHGKINE
ncbi:MAG: hypothetical protein ACLSGK_16085 [Lachnospiraceae bacterium]